MGDSDPKPPLSYTVDASPLARTIEASDAEIAAISQKTDPASAPVATVPATPAAGEPEIPKSTSGPNLAENPPRIGRYVLLRAIGEGGMGVVYAAYDEELDRKVAVKLIHPSRQEDPQLRTRILREAQALARVSAPNVIHVYQVGDVDGQLFIAMEFVNGSTLTKWQAEPGHSWQEILRMYSAAGQGLLAAHEAGLVHRDFKPDNVLIGTDGWPRVADFGLARLEEKTGSGKFMVSASLPAIRRGDSAQALLSPLTQAGVVLGTPLYMSPEQHMGDPADSRSDQFSFCVALYEALYKQQPFAGNTIEALAFNTISGRVEPRPPRSHVPSPVHEALLRGLSSAPEQRFPSMRELLIALSFDPSNDRAAEPRERRRVLLSMVAFVLVATMGMKVLRLLGVGGLTASLATAVGFLSIFVVLAFRFRRVLVKNAFHRGTLVYGLAFSSQLIGLRFLAMLIGLNLNQLVTLDLLALAATSGMTAAMTFSGVWPLVPLALVSSFAAAARQDYAEIIGLVAIPVATITSMLSWNRAAGARQPQRLKKK